MKKRGVKKTKGKRKKKKKTKGKKATKASSKDSDVAQVAQPVPITLPKDPWSKYKSPYGGSLSPADEWNRICQTGAGGKKQMFEAFVNIGNVPDSKMQSTIDAALHVPAVSTNSEEVSTTVAASAAAASATASDTNTAPAASASASASVSASAGASAAAAVAPLDGAASASATDGASATVVAEKLILRDHDDEGNVGQRMTKAVPFSSLMRATLISLDVSDTRVTGAALAAIGPCWLRELFVGGASLTAVPSLQHMPRLLKLHLHNHPELTLLHAAAFNTTPNLRELSVRSCGLTTLGKDPATAEAERAAATDGAPAPRIDNVLSKLMFLEKLDVAANKLLAPSLQSLTKLRQLQSLNLVGNPGLEQSDFSLAMFPKKLPRLKWIDGVEQRLRVGVTKVNLGKGQLSSLVASSGEDSASCSCLEGNPCAVRYNCKNWDKRYEIAKQARLRKGVRDI